MFTLFNKKFFYAYEALANRGLDSEGQPIIQKAAGDGIVVMSFFGDVSILMTELITELAENAGVAENAIHISRFTPLN